MLHLSASFLPRPHPNQKNVAQRVRGIVTCSSSSRAAFLMTCGFYWSSTCPVHFERCRLLHPGLLGKALFKLLASTLLLVQIGAFRKRAPLIQVIRFQVFLRRIHSSTSLCPRPCKSASFGIGGKWVPCLLTVHVAGPICKRFRFLPLSATPR